MYEIPEIDVAEVQKHKDKYILVDVREPHELIGPEGQIEGVILAPMGAGLAHFLATADFKVMSLFAEAAESGQACAIAHTYGFHEVYNLTGRNDCVE